MATTRRSETAGSPPRRPGSEFRPCWKRKERAISGNRDKVRATFLGTASGDAWTCRWRGKSYEEIRQKYGRLETYVSAKDEIIRLADAFHARFGI